MKKEIIIAVNEESAQILKEFCKEYPDSMVYIERKAFIGITEVVEFMVEITPELLAALSAYLIARKQYSQKEIRIKKGDIEIDLKDNNITPENVLKMLEKLEQKTKEK